MRSYLLTAVIALAVGAGLGLYLGWVQFPEAYTDSDMCQLDMSYQEDYTLMVARGYRQDQDIQKAMERLRPLRTIENNACQEGREPIVIEQCLSNTEREYIIDDIREWVVCLTLSKIGEGGNASEIEDMVILSQGLGGLTDEMERFLPLEQTPQ